MLFVSVLSFSQEDADTTTSTLNKTWVTSAGTEPIDIEKADRVFYKIKFKPEVKTVTEQQYAQYDYAVSLKDLNPRMRIPKMPGGTIPVLYGNYVKAGFGNYITPYLDVFLGGGRNEKFLYGLNYRHLSSGRGPVDMSNSGYSTNHLQGYGKMFTEKLTFGARASYDRNMYKFYGYKGLLASDTTISEIDSDKRIFNRFGIALSVDNRPNIGGVKSSNDLNFYTVSDNLVTSELGGRLQSSEKFKINDDFTFLTTLDGNLRSTSINDSTLTDFAVSVVPAVKFVKSEVTLTTGVNLTYTSDTLNANKKFHLYPSLLAEYEVKRDLLKAYAGMKGAINWNSWNSMMGRNPVLGNEVSIVNENEELNIYGGVKGTVKTKFNYSFRVGYRSLNNLMTFLNDSVNTSRFRAVYEDVDAGNVYSELELSYSLNDKLRSNLKARFDSWKTESLAAAWHLPTTDINLNTRYKMFDKMYINTDFYYISGIRAYDFDSNNEITLDNIVDLNVGVDYLIGSKFSAFLNVNNVLSANYQRYLNYPSQGINLIGGCTYAF